MAAVYGWSPAFQWAAIECCPPFRLIGLYRSRYLAAERALEFGAPAEVHAVPDLAAAQFLAQELRARREGR